jgi:hypothetical protein
MGLPFTDTQFLDVFGRYNSMLWPAVAALWAGSAAVIAIAVWRTEPPHRTISLLLAVLWAWSAVAYHAAFFTRINPAAWFFAGFFLIEAGLLLWIGVVKQRLRFSTGHSVRHRAAGTLVVFGLAYPFINLLQGLAFPRMPTFGMPCPTAILTAGVLLAADRLPRTLIVIPVVWALIGGSAALQFGIYADLMLFASAALLGAFTLKRPAGSSAKANAGAGHKGLHSESKCGACAPQARLSPAKALRK